MDVSAIEVKNIIIIIINIILFNYMKRPRIKAV